MVTKRIIGKTIYPRPHNLEHAFDLSTVDTNQRATTYPLIHYDEGLGDPASYNSHPEHASFAEVSTTSVYPDSKISTMHVKIILALTKHCWNTDKIEEVLVRIIPIYFAFKEDYEAIDELSTNEVQDILEMQKETTDRQGYPIYNGTDLDGDLITLGTTQLGLTTDTKIEGITFSAGALYDGLQYYTNKRKLQKCMGRIMYRRVRRREGATLKMNIRLVSKVKRANPYMFCGFIIDIPNPGGATQLFEAGDDSAGDHILCKVLTRYNEWHENFDHNKV